MERIENVLKLNTTYERKINGKWENLGEFSMVHPVGARVACFIRKDKDGSKTTSTVCRQTAFFAREPISGIIYYIDSDETAREAIDIEIIKINENILE